MDAFYVCARVNRLFPRHRGLDKHHLIGVRAIDKVWSYT